MTESLQDSVDAMPRDSSAVIQRGRCTPEEIASLAKALGKLKSKPAPAILEEPPVDTQPPSAGEVQAAPSGELNVIDGGKTEGSEAEPDAPELDAHQDSTIQPGHVLSDKAYATICKAMFSECPPMFQWQKEIRYTLRKGSTRWLVETLWGRALQYAAMTQAKPEKPLIVPASR